MADGPGNRLGDGLEPGGCGISEAIRVRHTDPFPWLQEKKEHAVRAEQDSTSMGTRLRGGQAAVKI